jgi:Second Messenger Oligonucleotide or Dinucleotide Synthetase domain
MSNKSTLQVRIRNFVNWIAPDKATRDSIKKQSGEIQSRIKAKAEEDGLTVTDTPYSGSFSKKSGLRRHLRGESVVEGQDIDNPFVVKPDKETELQPLIDRFEKYARASYPDTKIKPTKSSVKMEFIGTQLTYDIVPMFSTTKSDEQILFRGDGERIKTSIQKHREFIRSRTRKGKLSNEEIAFNDLIRLLKWWRYHKQKATGETITVISFLIDLLSAKAFDTCGVEDNYPQTLSNWFSFLAHVVQTKEPVWFGDYYSKPTLDVNATWNVLDPVTADNNIVKKWASWEIKELSDWFQEGSEIMNRAIVADLQGRDSDALEQMKLLFGKIFASHCD